MAEYINKTKKEVVLMEYSELKKRHFGTNDTDKKITDEEIIKALEYCLADRIECDKCVLQRECESNPFYSTNAKYALDLINRQKAEIERLKKEVSVARDAYISIQDRYEHTKAEAYKESTGIIKDKWFDNRYDRPDVDCNDFISNLLKEIIGKEE